MAYEIQWLRLALAFAVIHVITSSSASISTALLLHESGDSILKYVDTTDILWGLFVTLDIMLLSWVFFRYKLYKRQNNVEPKSPLRIIIVHIVVLSAIYVTTVLLTGSHAVAIWLVVIMTIAVGMARFLVLENLIFRITTPEHLPHNKQTTVL